MVFNSRNMLQNVFHDINNSSQHRFIFKLLNTYRSFKQYFILKIEIGVKLAKRFSNDERLKMIRHIVQQLTL